jgi:uncharacterized membrane-anchored protein YhcB (DUF1043 family)
MFIETIFAVAGLAFAGGLLVGYLRLALPLVRENTALHRERTREWRQRQYRREARQHFGTPYLPVELRDALSTVVDDHIGSRRADLEVVR